MRNAPTLALSALFLLLGCKNPGGDDSTSSSSTGDEPHCSEGYGDGPDVDPDFPACGCAPERCADGGGCRFTGLGDDSWTSSVCLPTCKDDSECPTLSGKPTKCTSGEYCRLSCEPGDGVCPVGYVCGESGECQVDLTKG